MNCFWLTPGNVLLAHRAHPVWDTGVAFEELAKVGDVEIGDRVTILAASSDWNYSEKSTRVLVFLHRTQQTGYVTMSRDNGSYAAWSLVSGEPPA